MELSNATVAGDIFHDYLNKIRDEYSGLKLKLSFALTRIQQLEKENELLKLNYSTSDDSIENKRRKRTDSFDKQALQAEAGDVNCADDDEVIDGTPQPALKSSIQVRLKKQNRLSRSSLPEQAKHSNSVTPVKVSPTVKSDSSGNTVPIRKPKEENSPLRRIENEITRIPSNKPLQSADETSKWLSKTPLKKSIPIIGTHTPPQRKTINLSLSKAKTKQTTLKFVHSAVKLENNSTFSNNLLTDMDETYCNELSTPLNLGLSSVEKFKDKENNDKLFNFRSTPLNEFSKSQIKPEPKTPNGQANRTAVSSKSSTREPRFAFESSSVFEVENPTDDIICIEDSEPLFLDDLADQMPTKSTEVEFSPEKPVRTEYRRHVQARTNREKAAQPGHMCPECADWYKIIGPGLSTREIQRRLNDCSRHRREMILPETPDGFWVPFFAPTQPNESSFEFRLQNRQQLENESQNF